jgi:hypothetical protein
MIGIKVDRQSHNTNMEKHRGTQEFRTPCQHLMMKHPSASDRQNIMNRSAYLAILLFAPLLVFAQEAREILEQVEHNMRGHAFYAEMTMETVRPGHTTEISMRIWSLGDDYALIYITAPAREAGTAYLKRKNEIWNYQPRIDRTVRMPPSMMSQSWMGSDFTNNELVSGTSTVHDFHHELAGTVMVESHECYMIELVPWSENPVVYNRVIYYVSREFYLPLMVENYDEHDDLVNTIHFREIREFDGRNFPAVMEMIPSGEEERKTVITTHSIEFGIDISEKFFSIENLTEIK